MVRASRNASNRAPAAARVPSTALDAARTALDAAREQLEQAERGDPSLSGWDSGYEAALTAHRGAERRLEALERLHAAQVERGGKRDAAAKKAAGDLEAIAAGLAASRDEVAEAAAGHLRALSALSGAVEAHNRQLAEGRAKVARCGLQVRDDLVAEGQEHAEGVLDGGGLRAGGTDWTRIPAGAVEAHGVRLVFGGMGPLHPLRAVGKYLWRSHEVTARPDGLQLPALADAGATVPEPPPQLHARRAPITREDGTAA